MQFSFVDVSSYPPKTIEPGWVIKDYCVISTENLLQWYKEDPFLAYNTYVYPTKEFATKELKMQLMQKITALKRDLDFYTKRLENVT